MNKYIEHDVVLFREAFGVFSHYTNNDFCVIHSINEDGSGAPIELHSTLLKKIGRLPMSSRGKLTTIVGPMSSGKTLELIRRLTINKIQGKKVIVAKHNIDTRDIKNPEGINNVKVQSRLGLEYDAISFANSGLLKMYIKKLEEKPSVLGIEEGQFWDDSLASDIDLFLNNGIDIIVTGLNQNFRGEPFGIMPGLMAKSDEIQLLSGVCSVCKDVATKTQRLINDEPAPVESPDIIVGAEQGAERYECRCINCWSRPI